jgi:hypothetical protein
MFYSVGSILHSEATRHDSLNPKFPIRNLSFVRIPAAGLWGSETAPVRGESMKFVVLYLLVIWLVGLCIMTKLVIYEEKQRRKRNLLVKASVLARQGAKPFYFWKVGKKYVCIRQK